MEKSIDKIDLTEIIGDYIIENIPGFQSYLRQVWKDLSGREEDKDKGLNKIMFSKYYELPGIISERLFSVLNSNKTNYLSCNDFIEGMVNLFLNFMILIKMVKFQKKILELFYLIFL